MSVEPKIVGNPPPKSSICSLGLETLFSPSILGVFAPLFLVQHPKYLLRRWDWMSRVFTRIALEIRSGEFLTIQLPSFEKNPDVSKGIKLTSYL